MASRPTPRFPRKGLRWSDEDVRLLQELLETGASLQEIARVLGRPFGAVRQKSYGLGPPSTPKTSGADLPFAEGESQSQDVQLARERLLDRVRSELARGGSAAQQAVWEIDRRLGGDSVHTLTIVTERARCVLLFRESALIASLGAGEAARRARAAIMQEVKLAVMRNARNSQGDPR